MPIPHLIHTVLLDGYDHDPRIQACLQSVQRHHGDFEYHYHRDNAVFYHHALQPIRNDLEKAWERFGALPRSRAYQSDLIKLAALVAHGGLALDGDLYCLKPLTDLLSDERGLWCNINRGPLPILIGEHCMACVPHDEMIWDCLRFFCTQAETHNNMVSCSLSQYVLKHRRPFQTALVTCPHGRHEPNNDLCNYRHDETTRAIHLWSSHSYDLNKLKELEL